jgi:hypothetical protein
MRMTTFSPRPVEIGRQIEESRQSVVSPGAVEESRRIDLDVVEGARRRAGSGASL